jgi:hypothetical protein
VPPQVVYMRCEPLMTAYLRLCTPQEALAVIGRANALREAAGPPTGDRGLLDPAAFPSPYDAPTRFWQEVFVTAGKKSPRMLAALLHAVDEESLPSAAREARRSFLVKLETWSTDSN